MEKRSGLLNLNGPPKRSWTAALSRPAGLALLLALALMPGGCLGGNQDEADEARLKRDEYRSELQRLHLSNDSLKREISDTYASCDLIGSQLTVMAAMNIHDKYTDGLGRRPQVTPPPTPDSRPRPAVDQGNRPQVSSQPTPRPRPAVDQGNRPQVSSQPSPRPRPGGDQGNRPQVSPAPPVNPVAPPVSPPPPVKAGGGGDGAIDWGI